MYPVFTLLLDMDVCFHVFLYDYHIIDIWLCLKILKGKHHIKLAIFKIEKRGK